MDDFSQTSICAPELALVSPSVRPNLLSTFENGWTGTVSMPLTLSCAR